MRSSSRRFHRRSAPGPSSSVAKNEAAESRYSESVRSRPKPSPSRNGSSSDGSRKTAPDSERDAALNATSASSTSGLVASSSPSAG